MNSFFSQLNVFSLSHGKTLSRVSAKRLLPFLSCLTACSSAAVDNTSGETSGGTPPIDFTKSGKWLKCGTGQYTCIKNEPICEDEYYTNKYTPYLLHEKATCAKTFGGDLDDYPFPSTGYTVLDWPQPTQDSEHNCEFGVDYESYSYETVKNTNFNISNAVPFTNSGIANDGCGWADYCEQIAAIQMEGFTLPDGDDPVCNADTDPTGGDTDTEDGNGLLGPWRCVGSASSACGEAERLNDMNVAVPENICPIPDDAAPGTEVCVLATDEATASMNCSKQCEAANGSKLMEDIESSSYLVTEEMHCDVYDASVMTWVENVDLECALKDVKPGLVDPHPFDFTVALVTDGGGVAGSGGHYGSLDFSVDNCIDDQCVITIRDVMLPYYLYEGSFSVGTSAPVDYSVSGLHLRLLKPATGTVDETTGIVYFTSVSSAFEVVASTGAVELDGVPIDPLADVHFTVTQVVGSYTDGELTLNISYNTLDANVAVTITTR